MGVALLMLVQDLLELETQVLGGALSPDSSPPVTRELHQAALSKRGAGEIFVHERNNETPQSQF